MKVIPAYMVSYKGMFYPAGEPFQIAADDAEMMSEHGRILEDEHGQQGESERMSRRGRPRKQQE